MGCDIHVHVEIKVAGKWEHWSAPYIRRDYQLFGKMAGVRDEDVEPIVKPRGIPPMLSVPTALDYAREGPDAHTPSWLTGEEAIAVQEWYESKNGHKHPPLFGYVFGNYVNCKASEEECPKEVTDTRVVFWFDN